MQIAFKPSVISLALASAFALAGCSTPSDSPSQKWVPATEIPAGSAEIKRQDGGSWDGKFYRGPDGDDYRASDQMTGYSSEPGWKNEHDLEVEKIHRLAKLCIQVNNTSQPCQEIIRLNARTGRFFILRDTMGHDEALKEMQRSAAREAKEARREADREG